MWPPIYQKFPLFGKESPHRGDSLDRFRKFLGAFIRLTIVRQRFKFHVIRIIGYGVIAEKPRQIFSCTLQEKLRWIEKRMTPFMMGTTSSITMQSLGKIVQRALAVGAKMCLFFCLFILSRSESGAPCVRGVHSSNTHCVAVYKPISTRFAAFFSDSDCTFRYATVLTFVARWCHNFC